MRAPGNHSVNRDPLCSHSRTSMDASIMAPLKADSFFMLPIRVGGCKQPKNWMFPRSRTHRGLTVDRLVPVNPESHLTNRHEDVPNVRPDAFSHLPIVSNRSARMARLNEGIQYARLLAHASKICCICCQFTRSQSIVRPI